MNDVTRILSAIEQGDPQAAERLLPLVYDELRKLAAQRLAQEKPGQTLQATALVHEAYLRLVGGEQRSATGTAAATSSPPRPRPCAASSSTTPAASRPASTAAAGGGSSCPRALAEPEARSDDLLALDEALAPARGARPRGRRLVKLRYFAGLSHRGGRRRAWASAAATADRHWAYARAWLFRQLVEMSRPAPTFSAPRPPSFLALRSEDTALERTRSPCRPGTHERTSCS